MARDAADLTDVTVALRPVTGADVTIVVDVLVPGTALA